jgi:tight adherence protein B
MIGPLLFGVLVALGVMLAFAAFWRYTRARDPVEERLQEYGADELAAGGDQVALGGARRRRSWTVVSRLLAGFGLGPRLAAMLTGADVPLTAAEFAVVMLGAALVGFAIGTMRSGVLAGLALGATGGVLPIFYLRYKRSRRLRAFTEQLPDVLTLLVGALQAGYGLAQALEALVEQLPPPASTEFARVMRATTLGLPLQRALTEMSQRVPSDDLNLIVTAINVQYEMGGNLAQTLETIGQTVRDRLRMLREIRVLTAQQRLTGYVLAGLPFVVGFALFMINPEYMGLLFEPGWIRILPASAAVMQVVGFFVIRRIVDIEV